MHLVEQFGAAPRKINGRVIFLDWSNILISLKTECPSHCSPVISSGVGHSPLSTERRPLWLHDKLPSFTFTQLIFTEDISKSCLYKKAQIRGP